MPATIRFKPLLDRDFLRGALHYEYENYKAGDTDDELKKRLIGWSKRELKRETQAEASFTQRFFVETWGYSDDGVGAAGFQLYPKFAVAGAGQGGHRGEADLAIGAFGDGRPPVPQVVCEYKDLRSGLDAPQNRKGNTRSPVFQARDYLWNARRGLFGNEPVQPRFAIVTDMDEFRLYWWDHFPDRYLRFRIGGTGDLFDQSLPLIGDGEEAQFDRFLFWRLFRPDMLLSDAGRTRLERLIEKQGTVERKLEGRFYADYRAYRQVLIDNIIVQRPASVTRSGAVRLAQKLLDRLIFVMFAEDMGGRVGFPPGALVDELKRQSADQFLEAEGDEVWQRLRRIFSIMNSGGRLGQATIHQFNGGLFADDPQIAALTLPNRLFVRFGQARTDATIEEHKDTLLYLAARYNFAREGGTRDSIGLYTLGHIFEQSIVELEKLEADAENRPSLTEVTQRKRDGVYYTPEWVVERIVEETIDPLLTRWRRDAGWRDGETPTRDAAGDYWARLRGIKVIDPACGSGAFLIVALRYLERAFAAAVGAAVDSGAIDQAPDAAAITDMILAGNLYGVDINPASVEITRLSLWLHTARANRPLSGLDGTIRCGNSLIDTRFYNKRRLDDPEERDRINTFEWEDDFAEESFDAVIGNPPYVKLQNFVKVNADAARWLTSGSSGEAPYASTGTGNFDLYLPFIEKGLALLNGGGRMGYIAPSLWPTLDYGEGLRGIVHAGRHLEKWLDFRSFQVFEEATTYTAIQIFSKAPVEAITLAFAPDGDISRVDWSDPDYRVAYDSIGAPLQPWLLAPALVREMVARLGKEADRLDSAAVTKKIIVGVQATINDVYHLTRQGRDTYIRHPKQVKGKPRISDEVVKIEDAVMRPLISGREARRFISPSTEIFIVWPYRENGNVLEVIPEKELKKDYPLAYCYLERFKDRLVKDQKKCELDESWYKYTYPKNLALQNSKKLIVAQLVTKLRLSFDSVGSFWLDNVRVNGVLPSKGNGWFLLGVLNAPATNMIFTWLGKPKDNGYYEANKQFIAPLPIPRAGRADKAALAALAQRLQKRHTARVAVRGRLAERLEVTARANWPLERLLPGVRSVAAIEVGAPAAIAAGDRKRWVDDQRQADEEAALARLDALLGPDAALEVTLADGKLSLLIDDQEAARAFVEEEGPLVAAQWRAVALGFEPRGRKDGERLVKLLRRVAVAAEPAVLRQILDLAQELGELDGDLRADEAALHEMTCRLFALTPEERRLVEAGR